MRCGRWVARLWRLLAVKALGTLPELDLAAFGIPTMANPL